MIQSLKRDLTSTPGDQPSRNQRTLRVAIIGGGPKGMYCLDSLCRSSRDLHGNDQVQITIYEPSEYCGAGNVYDLNQPEFLRMNFAAEKISAWKDDVGKSEDTNRKDLSEWLSQEYPDLAQKTDYVPRRIVGEYLHDCFRKICATAPKSVSIKVLRQVVVEVNPAQGQLGRGEQGGQGGQCAERGWLVRTGESESRFDEIMIATGHGGWRPANNILPLENSITELTHVDHVFPVEQQLSHRVVPPGCRIAIGGFSLTFIDAALALTEGREGCLEFQKSSDSWDYRSSGNEPAKIFPFSRSGRPMLSKPVSAKVGAPEGLADIWSAARRRLVALDIKASMNFENEIWPIILDAAQQALDSQRDWQSQNGMKVEQCSTGSSGSVETWFKLWQCSTFNSTAVLATLQRSFDIAHGRVMVDEGWALGEAWRQLYRELVCRVSHGGLATDQWPEFWQVAGEMERIAFGPPAENVGRLIALIKSGIVDLDYLRCDVNTLVEGLAIDVLIDATIASPFFIDENSFVGKLLAAGHLVPTVGARGIAVDENGRALGDNGQVVQRMAVVGRLTEGWVLGNDTLSRQLHHHPDRWADSVIHECNRSHSDSQSSAAAVPSHLV